MRQNYIFLDAFSHLYILMTVPSTHYIQSYQKSTSNPCFDKRGMDGRTDTLPYIDAITHPKLALMTLISRAIMRRKNHGESQGEIMDAASLSYWTCLVTKRMLPIM